MAETDQSASVRRVVVKVGSAVVAPGGRMHPETLERIVDEIAELVNSGIQVVLVSSGAVSAGFRSLGLDCMPLNTRQKQAAAAIGQPTLIRTYAEKLAHHSITAAQVLLTADDFGRRERFLNARDTLETLLEAGITPIINENDSVVFDEIKLGDNDRLSALAASCIHADLLVLLSVAPGLVDMDTGTIIPRVTSIAEARSYVDETVSSGVGTGGMGSKLEAIGIVMEHGIPAVLTAGPTAEVSDPIARVLRGEAVGTRFDVNTDTLTARKSWIAHAAAGDGAITVDDGAATAVLERGASLLPGGILRVDGHFDSGSAVEIRDLNGLCIARGLASYNSAEIDQIKGSKSGEIERLLGYMNTSVVVHRDDLQLIGGDQ
jgi:glutamate 5-kinase